MYDQMNLFDCVAAEEKAVKNEVLFQKWLQLPEKMLVPAGTHERERLLADVRAWYSVLYQQAQHTCPQMPADKYIWLNEVEPAEFWVLNTVGEVCGEQADECPFCGANLKHGGGDAVLIKAGSRFWAVSGFLKDGD